MLTSASVLLDSLQCARPQTILSGDHAHPLAVLIPLVNISKSWYERRVIMDVDVAV